MSKTSLKLVKETSKNSTTDSLVVPLPQPTASDSLPMVPLAPASPTVRNRTLYLRVPGKKNKKNVPLGCLVYQVLSFADHTEIRYGISVCSTKDRWNRTVARRIAESRLARVRSHSLWAGGQFNSPERGETEAMANLLSYLAETAGAQFIKDKLHRPGLPRRAVNCLEQMHRQWSLLIRDQQRRENESNKVPLNPRID